MESPSRSRVKFKALVFEPGEKRTDGLAGAQTDRREGPVEFVFHQRIGNSRDEYVSDCNRYV